MITLRLVVHDIQKHSISQIRSFIKTLAIKHKLKDIYIYKPNSISLTLDI